MCGKSTMRVMNRHALNRPWPIGSVYIGRGTPLGNPFVMGRDGDRAEVIAKYRVWLIAKIHERDTAVMRAMHALNHESILVCSCAPKPCHAEVIKQLWRRI